MKHPGTAIIATGLLVVLTVIPSVSFAQDQGKALIEAAKQGDLKQAQALLDKRADANTTTVDRETALKRSAAMGRRLVANLQLAGALTLI